MSWTTPADLRAQVRRLWARGVVLGSQIEPDETFPKRLILKGPTGPELSTAFDDARAWIAALQGAKHLRIETREIRHRVLGANRVPHSAWIDSAQQAAACIGETEALRRFRELASITRARQPALMPWLKSRPLDTLALAEDWPRLLDIVDWFQANPRPGIYARQVDLPGIHTKFIDMHRSAIATLLDRALREEAIDDTATGAAGFARRYGLREKPIRIRFRGLDPQYPSLAELPGNDITLTHDAFAALELGGKTVFITENEVNFLAFPDVRDALVIFGSGYGFNRLAEAHWLARCPVHYWGDIDTHGFAILDQLREYLPHASSFLMDRETLMRHAAQWVSEPKPSKRSLTRLTAPEQALCDDLRYDRLGASVRLEQERVGYGYVRERVGELATMTVDRLPGT